MYIFYLFRHKFWVFWFCCQHGLIWRGLIHDWDKFLPSMLSVYGRHFPSIRTIRDTSGCYDPLTAPIDYQHAILSHFHRSKHHWQHWVLANGQTFQALDIPEVYVREMICDWAGAGRTRKGKNWTKACVRDFFNKTRPKMVFSEKTIQLIEKNLDSMGF